jgi:hypothetical protein
MNVVNNTENCIISKKRSSPCWSSVIIVPCNGWQEIFSALLHHRLLLYQNKVLTFVTNGSIRKVSYYYRPTMTDALMIETHASLFEKQCSVKSTGLFSSGFVVEGWKGSRTTIEANAMSKVEWGLCTPFRVVGR